MGDDRIDYEPPRIMRDQTIDDANDGEGDLDCVVCANPAIDWTVHPIEHSYTGNCERRPAVRGWWNMACWNALSAEQQQRLIEVGNLEIGSQPLGDRCKNGAQVAVETEWDRAPGPRFYCAYCAIQYLALAELKRELGINPQEAP